MAIMVKSQHPNPITAVIGVPGDISIGTLQMKVFSISEITSATSGDSACHSLHHSHPQTGRPWPKVLEGEPPARFTREEADRDTYRRTPMPPVANKKPETGASSATEFQFKG